MTRNRTMCSRAERDQQEALRLRAAFGENGNLLWHGDVFKLVFYIDFCPSFDYCTIVESGNPQTLVWKAKEPLPRLPLFDSLEKISRMSFIDLLQNLNALRECVEEDAVSRCVANLLSR